MGPWGGRAGLTPGVLSLPLDKDPRRRWAYGLREVSREVLNDIAHEEEFRGLRHCGFPVREADKVALILLEVPSEGGLTREAFFSGLQTCGSAWACPVCSTALADERSEALGRVVSRMWHRGYRVAHAVLTVRHTNRMPLREVLGALSRAWRWLVRHRRVRGLLRGWEWHRGVEITWGGNGWHPHLHLLLLSPPGVDPWVLKEPLWEAWRDAVEAVGWLPSSRGGYVFQVAEDEADAVAMGRYQEKWGLSREASGPKREGKGGWSPWEILEVAGGGLDTPGVMSPHRPPLSPEEARVLWVEYAEATLGRKRTGASRRLSRAIRAEVERLKVERQGGGRIVEVAEIRRGVYLWLLRERRLAYLLHWAEILGPGRACELAGLVEGEEYWVWRPTTGPPSQTEVA